MEKVATDEIRWVLGLKFGEEDKGALSVAGWLRASSKGAVFMAHHTSEVQFPMLEPALAAQLNSEAHKHARQALDAVDIEDARVNVAARGNTEINIAVAARSIGADGIILGRRARSEELRLARLGPVARRLLRQLPTPVVVAGPDLASAGVGSGPVLLAIDGDTDARRACTFAKRVAAAVHRELAVVHVYPSVAHIAAPYVPVSHWGRLREATRASMRARFQEGVDEAGAGGLRQLVAEGPVVPRILEVARDEQACLVVCSSRQLSVAERIFDSSVGSSLAAAAPFPVAVVPSGSNGLHGYDP